jgi:multicomponent K+:H+ antiporter subunit F
VTALVLPYVAAALALALLLNLWRLARGPGLPDRILALDTLYINALGLLITLGLVFDTWLYFETALIIAMLGFTGTVVLAKYVTHRDIVE